MTTVKILCPCGTKFAFEADETLTLAAGVIQCPSCGADAANAANAQLLAARGATATPQPAGTRLAVRKPAAETPAANEGAEAGERPEPPPTQTLFAQSRKLTKSEQQIRRNRELERRRRPYVAAAVLILIAVTAAWSWYRFAGSKPRVVLAEQFERAQRPVVARLLDNQELFLIRNRDVSLRRLPAGKVLWEQSFGSVTNFDDHIPMHVESFQPIDRPTPEVRLTTSNLWIIWPDHIVNLDRRSGNPVLSRRLEDDYFEVRLGEKLLVIEQPGATNQLQFELLPLDGGAGRTVQVPLLANEAPPEIVPDGDSIALIQTRLLESKFITNKLSTGPKVMTATGVEKSVDQNTDRILEETMTVGQSLEAVTQIMAESRRLDEAQEPDEITEDHSRYEVEVRRPGGGPSWKGEVTGPPLFFPLASVDVVHGEKQFTVIDKHGREQWSATLTYPLSEEALRSVYFHLPAFSRRGNIGSHDDQTGLKYHFPFVEQGSRLYAYDGGVLSAFDLATGEVKWRVTSVGIRKLQFDHQGRLYLSTTLDSPEGLNRTKPLRRKEPVWAIVKIDPDTGQVLWRSEHLGSDIFFSGKFLYSQWLGVNVYDMAKAAASGTELVPSCAVARIDLRSGKPMWRREYRGEPGMINIRGNWLLVQYPRQLEVVRFFAL